MESSQNPKSSQSPSHPSEEKLSLALLNINGLRNKTHEVRHIIARDKLHVVALCETKLNTTVSDTVVHIPGFRMWRKDRNDERNNKGGGVALYVQDHIETRLRPDLMNSTSRREVEDEAEIIWVEMKLSEGRPVLLGCCYRPTKDEKKYLKHIEEMKSSISEENNEKDIFLMGDFNVHWNSDVKEKTSKVLSWTQIVDGPTRVTLDSETCIDHIYTNVRDRCSKPESIATGSSDHNLITVKTNRKIPPSKGNFRPNQFDKKNFQKDIEGGDWAKVCKLAKSKKTVDLKEALAEFTKIFLQAADKYAPLKNQDIYSLLKLDAQLEKLLSERDKVKYEMINTIYKSIKERKKIQENIDKILEGKPQNPKSSNSHGNNSTETSPFHLPQTEASEEKHKTNTDPGSVSGNSQFQKRNGRSGAGFTAVTGFVEYVCDHVVKVIDETEAELFKLSVKSISAPIRDILKGCREIGEFPDELKKIKSFSFLRDNYLHIRQSSSADRVHIILSYVFDVFLYKQFKSSFIEDQKKLIETLQQQIGEADRAVLLDFTYSFDTISHDQLIKKLEKSDFLGSDLKLIKSFLSSQESSSGLPRGSCLAQLLSIIIMNDLKENLQPSAVICNSYMMICGDESELRDKMETVEKWAKKLNIPFRNTQKLLERPVMLKILESMVRFHGDESNWIRAPGNIVKENGDWKYDNVSKELELHFGPDSLQRFGTQNQKLSEDPAGEPGRRSRRTEI